MWKNTVSAAYALVFGAAAIASFVFFEMAAPPFSFGTLVMAFIASLIIGVFYPGDKSRLQLIFLSAGAALTISTIHLDWGWGGWVGAGLCLFMVATMKLDGGDGYGG